MDRFYTTQASQNFTTQSAECSDCTIINRAVAQGYYIPQPGGSAVTVKGEDSFTLGCIFADITKTADRDFAAGGDTIKYTISFKNMSSREMYNVKIVDSLSPYLTVISSSINPAPQRGESLESGVSIGSVAPYEEKSLTFSARVAADAAEDIVNRSYADFYFRDCQGVQQSASTHITSITTPVRGSSLTVEKTADKSFVTSDGETVVFTIRVKNSTQRVIGDVVVTDKLPEGMVYIPGSTVINGGSSLDSDPAGGIYIGAMDTNSEATVVFSAAVQLKN